MSGESQRWLHDDIMPSPAGGIPRAHKRFDVGEMSPPHSGHWSLSGVPEEEFQRAKQLDSALERRLCGVPFPAKFEASLHALVETLADDLAG